MSRVQDVLFPGSGADDGTLYFKTGTIVQSDPTQKLVYKAAANPVAGQNMIEYQKNDGTVLTAIRSDGFLVGTTGVVAGVKAGTPSDVDYTTPTTGTLVVDTTGNKIWARTGVATWKGVAIA